MNIARLSLGAAIALPAVLLFNSPSARGGSVVIDPSASLNASVDSSLIPPDADGDIQSDSDTGGLTKPSVSANATANLAGGDQPDRSAAGSANSTLELESNGFDLDGGTTASILPDLAFAAAAHVQSVSTVDLPFSLDDATGKLSYSINIDTMVLKNEKVTLLLDRTGENPQSLFSQVFTASDSGEVDDLSAGQYRLQVIAGSEATNRGVQGEHGSTRFNMSMSSRDDGGDNAMIPLPPGADTGAIALGAVFLGLTLLRRRTIV